MPGTCTGVSRACGATWHCCLSTWPHECLTMYWIVVLNSETLVWATGKSRSCRTFEDMNHTTVFWSPDNKAAYRWRDFSHLLHEFTATQCGYSTIRAANNNLTLRTQEIAAWHDSTKMPSARSIGSINKYRLPEWEKEQIVHCIVAIANSLINEHKWDNPCRIPRHKLGALKEARGFSVSSESKTTKM